MQVSDSAQTHASAWRTLVCHGDGLEYEDVSSQGVTVNVLV